MKIYTKGGDAGQTSLFGGERVSKNAPRVRAYGDVDELNSVLGVAGSEIDHDDLQAMLRVIQSSLFDLGGELATPAPDATAERAAGSARISDRDVAELEGWIDALETELAPLRNFILPGGVKGAALLHLARTVCRRAEREVIALGESEAVAAVLIRYLNRLSDLIFVMARVMNRRADVAEPQWIGRER
ncbi:MAG: cob(I)yrinic acid a,c-diamide adenosyltransferase [Deltaproteobacteria bacterium]|nr:cob(I)yrinic acid a,c-diamide adenosyltransferase [Deltaproteobacteria bacterium]